MTVPVRRDVLHDHAEQVERAHDERPIKRWLARRLADGEIKQHDGEQWFSDIREERADKDAHEPPGLRFEGATESLPHKEAKKRLRRIQPAIFIVLVGGPLV